MNFNRRPVIAANDAVMHRKLSYISDDSMARLGQLGGCTNDMGMGVGVPLAMNA